jgi:hypothetical protein
MLKTSSSFVLGSSKSSTYPRGYASGFDSPAALPDSLFEHPARRYLLALDMRTSEVMACRQSFPQPVNGMS